MTGLISAWRRLLSLRRREELQAGLDEEILFHIERQTEKNVRAGMAPEEARRRAMVQFGGVERTRENTRDQIRFRFVEDALRDFRYGARALLRAPAFTIAAAVTLALGIGATVAMFSVLNGVLLRPLPYPDQDRLIELRHEAPGLGISRLASSPAIYFAYRDHSRTFEAIGQFDSDSSPVTVTGRGEPEAVPSMEVTHEVLGILGAKPALGRGFTAADDAPGGAPTVVISDGYWRRRFGGANPVGQMLVVDGVPREIIGVLPRSFEFFDDPVDIFFPLQPVRSAARFPSFDGRAIVRLKPGVTLAEAEADIARMIPMLTAEFGTWDNARFAPKLVTLKERVVGSVGDTLWVLMGTIALLLLIACANVANLVLVRAQARRPQLAIRAALGAGWGALARAVFMETAVLGLAGGAAGLLVAYFSLPHLLRLGADELPQVMAVSIDKRVLLVTLGVSLLAASLFAVLPVLQLAGPRFALNRALHAGGRSNTGGRESHRTRHVLVVAQVALALVLLVGSGLMIRTFQRLRQVDPGFRDPASVQTFRLTIPMPATTDEAEAAASRERNLRTKHAILEALSAVPGVETVAFSSFNDGLPLDGDGRNGFFFVEGRPAPPEGTNSLKEIQFVSPAFFEAMRTPVVAGRALDWSDVYQARTVVMVSENLALAEWGSPAAALGHRLYMNSKGPRFEIVGVVKDVHHYGLNEAAPPTVIRPAVASATASFVVRSPRVGTPGFLDDVRKAVWSVNGDLSLAGVRTLAEMHRSSMARASMTMKLLAITGAIALALGLIGVYGVVSYAVAQRRREIGIRLALGAQHGQVRRMFVRLALALVAVGVAIGLGAAAGLTRLMSSQLFGVSPLDPLTHLGVALALLAAAGLASYISAQRASALDPVEVLKAD
jgi:predicted permease